MTREQKLEALLLEILSYDDVQAVMGDELVERAEAVLREGSQ